MAGNGATADAGAVTWGSGPTGGGMVWAHDYVNDQLVVGRRADNIVTLFRFTPIPTVFLPVVLKTGP